MLNSINQTTNHSQSKISFGTNLMVKPPIGTKFLEDLTKIEKQVSHDGFERSITIKDIKDPETGINFHTIPQFISSIHVKINGSSKEIPVEVRIDSEVKDLAGKFEGAFAKADSIAKNLEQRIQNPPYEIKPKQMAAYKETIIKAADSTYTNAAVIFAEKTAQHTKKHIANGMSFNSAFETAQKDAFKEILLNGYEVSHKQESMAKAFLKSTWTLGDKIK